MTLIREDFQDADTVVNADDRGRLTLGAIARERRFLVSDNDVGQILLTPFVTLSVHEV